MCMRSGMGWVAALLYKSTVDAFPLLCLHPLAHMVAVALVYLCLFVNSAVLPASSCLSMYHTYVMMVGMRCMTRGASVPRIECRAVLGTIGASRSRDGACKERGNPTDLELGNHDWKSWSNRPVKRENGCLRSQPAVSVLTSQLASSTLLDTTIWASSVGGIWTIVACGLALRWQHPMSGVVPV